MAASAAALLSVAACGGGDGGTDETGTGTGAESPGAPTETFVEGGGAGGSIDMTRSEGPAPDVEGAQEGGTLTMLAASGLTTMDPTEAYYTNTAAILSGLVTRSLTQYVMGEDGDAVLIPDLASEWTNNEDYTEWTFTLREGIRYENGDEVKCRDYAYGIMRSMDRETFPGGAAYSNEFFLDGDKYGGPYKDGTNYEGVECNGNELTIKMEQPFPDMPFWGAFPAIGPIPPGNASDPAKYKNHPLATGPYMFESYEPGIELVLVKNPEWDPATDPGRHQYADRWEMRFTEDTAKLEQVLLSDTGNGQTTFTDESLTPQSYRQATQDAADRIMRGTTPCTYVFAPDYRKVTDINVRKALGWAYPYEDAAKAGGIIVGVTREFGTTLMPPGIPGRVEYDVLGNEGRVTDPQKARQLLQEAGEMGYEIQWPYIKGDELAEAAKDEIVEAMEEAGFTPKPVAVGINQYSAFRADPESPINVRPFGWCSDWPSGGSWFPPLLKSNGSNNYFFFEEKDVDQRIADIQSMPIEEQPAAWGELDEYVFTEYYPGPVYGYAAVAAMRGSRVGGAVISPVFGEPHFPDLFVSGG